MEIGQEYFFMENLDNIESNKLYFTKLWGKKILIKNVNLLEQSKMWENNNNEKTWINSKINNNFYFKKTNFEEKNKYTKIYSSVPKVSNFFTRKKF